MDNRNKISRKEFLRYIWVVIAAPFIFIWGMSVKRYREAGTKTQVRIADDIPNGISFFDEVVISKQAEDIKVYSAHCTHLGCIINNEVNREMVCPCHGSRFDANGKPTKGPAVERLRQLRFERQDGEIIIEV